MSGQTVQVPVTIERAQAQSARQALADWGMVIGAKIIGETDNEIGLYVECLITPVSASLLRAELEKRLKPFGGQFGARSEWLEEGQKLAKDWL